MKKIYLLILLMCLFSIMVGSVIHVAASSSDARLIKHVQMTLKNTENPKRLEVSFYLGERLDFSDEKADIIFEYFSTNSQGNLESLNYKKDKSWSGYLNSYDSYPSGERKYSKGTENNSAYSNSIPVDTIYTSTKTSSSIDVTRVTAVSISVFRSDGSGEQIYIYSDGTTSSLKKINIPVVVADSESGIKLEGDTSAIPLNTVLKVDEITTPEVHEAIVNILAPTANIVVYNIKLVSSGDTIQPNGKVKIAIPIPNSFDMNNIGVYKIENEQVKHSYPLTIEEREESFYAVIETDDFSIFVLAEFSSAQNDSNKISPPTGDDTAFLLPILILVVSAIGLGLLACCRRLGKKSQEK